MLVPDFDGDLEYAPMWAGESCSVVNDVKPAGEIVRDLVRGAEAGLANTEQLGYAFEFVLTCCTFRASTPFRPGGRFRMGPVAGPAELPRSRALVRRALGSAAAGGIALVLLGCQNSAKSSACGGVEERLSDLPAAYRIDGKELTGDVDGDGAADRVTLRADGRRPQWCRHLLVVEIRAGAAAVAVVKPLPWPGTDPELLLLAEIDGRAGLEPVVALSPAAVYQPGAVFTLRDGELLRMQLQGLRPGDLFPLADEFPAGVDCAGEPGTIVATFGEVAAKGRDDRHFDVRRSFYRGAGIRFELQRTEAFRVEVGPEPKQRWPELAGDPFRSCPSRVT